MKTTGSIRCEIISEVVDTDLYQVSVKDERHMSVLFCVPKSAVTDIHEEVEMVWKYNCLVAVWNYDRQKEDAMIGFYRRHVKKKVGVAWTKTASGVEDYCDNAMPLTDWLKEHGNKEERNEDV